MEATPPPVRRVPLAQASGDLIDACIAAAADDPAVFSDQYRASHRVSLRAERNAIRAGSVPAVRDLLVLPDGQAGGWVGWTRYKGPIEAWESTTFLAAPLRGTGMLAVARCWQVHLADVLRSWEHTTDVVLLSSIAPDNARSLAASSRYAQTQGWPPAWLSVAEPAKGRTSRVLLWPRSAPVPHTCFATNAG